MIKDNQSILLSVCYSKALKEFKIGLPMLSSRTCNGFGETQNLKDNQKNQVGNGR